MRSPHGRYQFPASNFSVVNFLMKKNKVSVVLLCFGVDTCISQSFIKETDGTHRTIQERFISKRTKDQEVPEYRRTMREHSGASELCINPSPSSGPSDLLLPNRRDIGCYALDLVINKWDSHYHPSFLFFSLAHSDQTGCHVVSCPVEKHMQQEADSGRFPQQSRNWIQPTTTWVSLKWASLRVSLQMKLQPQPTSWLASFEHWPRRPTSD